MLGDHRRRGRCYSEGRGAEGTASADCPVRARISRKEEDTMVTFDKAYKIAKRLKPNIDNGTEMADAFIFGSH